MPVSIPQRAPRYTPVHVYQCIRAGVNLGKQCLTLEEAKRIADGYSNLVNIYRYEMTKDRKLTNETFMEQC